MLHNAKGPEFTIRMLLGNTLSESKETPKLKAFSHFTLGCTQEDETPKVKAAFEKLAQYFKGSATFKPEAVINLGSESQPLWALSLNLGAKEVEIRAILSEQFDSIMCPERNGNLYLWRATDKSQKKSAHLTIGPKKEDRELAEKILKANCEFIFNQMDYKKVGPHDPSISVKLEAESKPVNTQTKLSLFPPASGVKKEEAPTPTPAGPM